MDGISLCFSSLGKRLRNNKNYIKITQKHSILSKIRGLFALKDLIFEKKQHRTMNNLCSYTARGGKIHEKMVNKKP